MPAKRAVEWASLGCAGPFSKCRDILLAGRARRDRTFAESDLPCTVIGSALARMIICGNGALRRRADFYPKVGQRGRICALFDCPVQVVSKRAILSSVRLAAVVEQRPLCNKATCKSSLNSVWNSCRTNRAGDPAIRAGADLEEPTSPNGTDLLCKQSSVCQEKS